MIITFGEFSIKLEPEAIEIINRYKGDNRLLNVSQRYETHRGFLHYINRYLHGSDYYGMPGICSKIGIDKQVTTKWARHTWATFARNECKINKDDVALSLGHEDSDNVVTDIYIKYDYRIIDESNRKVLNTISGS
jgi:integrase